MNPEPAPSALPPGWQEVFTAGLRLPARVAIVAPGPQGRGHYGEIPADFFVIAVSKAILIPGLRVDLWMMNHVHQPWYPEASRRYRGLRVYSDEAAAADAANAANTAKGGPAPAGGCYCFMPAAEPLDPEVVRPVERWIRYGSSVTGCALQLAFNLGAAEILLCGADMSGDAYFDGTANPQPSHGETWPAVRCLDRLIRWLAAERGVRVWTLSETRLDVPRWRP